MIKLKWRKIGKSGFDLESQKFGPLSFTLSWETFNMPDGSDLTEVYLGLSTPAESAVLGELSSVRAAKNLAGKVVNEIFEAMKGEADTPGCGDCEPREDDE